MVYTFSPAKLFSKIKAKQNEEIFQRKRVKYSFGIIGVMTKTWESHTDHVHDINYNWNYADSKKKDFFISRSFAFKLLQTAPFLFLHFLA